MSPLINLLIIVLFFAIVAYGLWWTCTHFFPGFAPALWVCGVILIIAILLFVSGGGGSGFRLPAWR